MAADRQPTLRDVAQLSGVAPATVSYVLSPRPGKTISEATIRRVNEVAATLGYIPNSSAAALRRGHAAVILVVIEPIQTGDVSERVVAQLVAALSSGGHAVVVHTMASERDLLAVASSIRPEGIWGMAFLSDAAVEGLRARGVRRVRRSRPSADPAIARPWEHAIGRAQAEFLVARDYDTLIGFVPADNPRAAIYEARMDGIRSACQTLGRPAPMMITSTLDRAEIAAHLSSLNTSGRVAIAAVDDRTALGVLAAMSDLGWRAPSDLAVIGADNTTESAFAIPALTTVDIDLGLMGDAARAWLIESETEHTVSELRAHEVIDSVHVVERATT